MTSLRLAVLRETHHGAGPRLLHRRTRAAGVVLGDGRIVAADHVVPAVGPLDDAVGRVLAVVLRGKPRLGNLVAFADTHRVIKPAHTLVAVADQVVAVEVHAVGPALGEVGKQRGLVRLAHALGVVQDLDVAPARHHHPAMRIDGHRVDVAGQGVVGVKGDFETVGHLKAQVGRAQVGAGTRFLSRTIV